MASPKSKRMLTIKINDQLKLQLLKQSDAESLFFLINENRQHLRKHLGWLDNNTNIADTRKFIRDELKKFAKHESLQCGIWYKNKLAGVIGYHKIDWINKNTSIGYWLGDSFQGKGLVTSACKALVGHAFNKLGLNRVEIRCAVGNKRSKTIPESLGFQQEGILRQAEWLYDHFEDLVVYSIIVCEWNLVSK